MFGIRNIGSPELIIIGLLIILFFGGKKLSEFARGIADSRKELKNIKKQIEVNGKEKGA